MSHQNEPSRYRTSRLRPGFEKSGHVYVSANSLAWNAATAEQGGTVLLGAGRIASEQGQTIALTQAEAAAVDPDQTRVLAVASAPRVMTVEEVERELRRPARQDPPIWTDMVAVLGIPRFIPAAARFIDGESTITWTVGGLS